MATVEKFEDLEVWQLSRDLCQKIEALIASDELSRRYALKDQIDRSSGSIMDNIAEGFGRGGNKEFINFLGFAKGSCCETKSQLLRCLDRGYLSEVTFDKLNQ